MKKLVSMALFVFIGHAVFAQEIIVDSTKKTSKVKKEITYTSLNLKNRPNDHFLIELGYDNWAGKTDSMRTTGFSRSFAFYFMYDFPFKTDPHFSVGAGLGISASNIFFDKVNVLIAVPNPTLAFTDVSNSDHFKKYKLVTTFLEAPLELRYAFNPENPNKGWKIALGIKVGLLMSAYTKGKDLLNAAGQTENNYIEKQSSKQFFNSGRVAGTFRVNYGFIGVFGQLSLTPLVKTTAAPQINPYSFGILLSGL